LEKKQFIDVPRKVNISVGRVEKRKRKEKRAR